MQGSLADINVPDLVTQLYSARENGILRLSQGEVKKSLYFKEGSIVFAHSNLKHERLGEILLRLGKITEEEFQSVAGKMTEGLRLGQALYQSGFLATSEINAGVSYQIQQIVYSVFDWDAGEYEFQKRARPVYEDIMVDVSTPQMIIDGIRNMGNLVVLERLVNRLEDRVVSLNNGTRRLPRTNLDFSEETLLACLDGKSTSKQLRAMSRLSPFEFGRAMYCLSLSGMILFGGQDVIPTSPQSRPKSEAEVGPLHTNPMPQSSTRMKTFTEQEIRKLVSDTEKKFQDATDEEVLNVFPDSLPDEIRSAYEKLTGIFHPPYYATERYRDIKDPLKRIIDRLHAAQQHLAEKAAAQRPFLESELPGPVAITPVDLPENHFTGNATVPEQGVSVQELESRLKSSPGSTAMMRDLGLMLQHAGRAREGEKHLLRAIEIEPRSVENHFAIADFYHAQGLKFKAFKHLNVVLQIDPQNQKAMDLLGIKKRKGSLYEISK